MRFPDRSTARLRHNLLLLLLLSVVVLTLAGCAGSDQFPGSAVLGEPSNGIADRPPAEIVETALRNAAEAESGRLELRGQSTEGDDETTLTLSANRDGSVAHMKIETGSKGMELVRSENGNFIRGEMVWEGESGGSEGEDLSSVKDQWIRLEKVDPSFEGERLTVAAFLTDGETDSETDSGELTIEGERDIDGQPAVGVNDGGSIMWVATTGTAYPLLLEDREVTEEERQEADPKDPFSGLATAEGTLVFGEPVALPDTSGAKTFEEILVERL